MRGYTGTESDEIFDLVDGLPRAWFGDTCPADFERSVLRMAEIVRAKLERDIDAAIDAGAAGADEALRRLADNAPSVTFSITIDTDSTDVL